MYVTVTAPPKHVRIPCDYYGLIHGIGEEERKELRRHINSVFFRAKELKRQAEKDEVEKLKQQAIAKKQEEEQKQLELKKQAEEEALQAKLEAEKKAEEAKNQAAREAKAKIEE
jgi:colicin import membrane protein